MKPLSCWFGRHIWIDSLTPDIVVNYKGHESVTVEQKCMCCDETKIATDPEEN